MNPAKSGIVHLWDLPHKQIYIRLKKEHHDKLIRLIHDLFNSSHKEIAKTINEKSYLISCLEHNGTAESLDLFIKLYGILYRKGYDDFTLENLERHVGYMKAKGTATILFNPKLPFNFNSSAGGRMISAVLHDGSLTDGRFTYANNSGLLKEKIYKTIKEVFGDIKAYTRLGSIRFPKIIYYALVEGLKMSEGEKVITNPKFPDFVFDSPVMWKSVIDQAISDDGWIQTRAIPISITIDVSDGEKKEPQILLGDKEIFENLGIKTNVLYPYKKYKVYKNNKTFLREKWLLNISGKENLERISKIGISHPEKNRKLKNFLNSYKQNQYSYGENIKKALDACKKLEVENKEININNVASLIKRHPWRTSQILKQLVELNKIKEVRSVWKKFSPKLYKLNY